MEGWSESECYFVSTQNHSLWLLDQYVFKQPEIIFIKRIQSSLFLTHQHILNNLGVVDTVLSEDVPRYVIIQLPLSFDNAQI